MSNDQANELAGLEYGGVAGASRACLDAVLRLLQYGDRITHARILSYTGDPYAGSHCLLLTINSGDLMAVKSGFSSRYLGEGPHAFSYAIRVLEAHGAEIEEYEVSEDFIERVDRAALTKADLEDVDAARPVGPSRWHDYILDEDRAPERRGGLWREFPLLVPFALVDPRLVDLARTFAERPDEALLTGYRRLEDIVRNRTGMDEHGAKLFSQAFLGTGAKLTWDVEAGALSGRASLFAATFSAFRNPRAHRELDDNLEDQLAEFLLLNQLYRLESHAIEKPTAPTAAQRVSVASHAQ